jgi:glutamyl-tRNA reductase
MSGRDDSLTRFFARERAIAAEMSKLVLLELEELSRRMRAAGVDPLTCSLREYAKHVVAQRETAAALEDDHDVRSFVP